MILTGKALRDFIKWYGIRETSTLSYIEFRLMTEKVLQNAIIIEWFDSLKTLNKKRGVYTFKQLYLSSFKEMERHHSVLEIQKRAIIKANEIYNEINN